MSGLRRLPDAPPTDVIAKPARRVFLHERPELWQHEENRRREERRFWTHVLRYGPNDYHGRTDEEIRAVFDAWGREAGDWDRQGQETHQWDETTWARQRYINGLSVEDARAAMAKAEILERRHER